FALSLSVIPNRMRNALSSSAAATLIGKAPTSLFRFRVDGRNRAMRARQASSRIKLKKRDMGISSGGMEIQPTIPRSIHSVDRNENQASYSRVATRNY